MSAQMHRTFILIATDERMEVVETNLYLGEERPLEEFLEGVIWDSDQGTGVVEVLAAGIFNEQEEKWQVVSRDTALAA